MESDAEKYKPDFSPYSWTDRDRYFLGPFVSNPDGLVSVLRNLPSEVTGALCSRASRASGSLTEVLLKEYIYPILDGEDKELAKELEDVVKFLRERGFGKILNNQRAQAFYAKWLSQYGDDSIAQMTGTHLLLWGVSQVAMKFIEDQRIGLEPIEKSTRYVNFGKKIGGRYLYYVPQPDLEKIGLLGEYRETLDRLFDTYVSLIPKLLEWLKVHYDDKESVLEKKAFDTLRGLLPMATLGQVAFRGNAQAFEYLINRTAKHPLGELRWLALEAKRELDQEIPSLLLRVTDEKSKEYQGYLNRRYEEVREFAKSEGSWKEDIMHVGSKPEVCLVEWDPEGETKVLAGALFRESHGGWEQCLGAVKKLSDEKKKELAKRYLSGRSERWYKVGRAFENSYLRFEIVMNIGAYRDLHRHRMMTQERQLFSTRHGYDVPEEVEESGLLDPFRSALERADALYKKIEAHDRDLAQYAVPLAYRMRFYEWQNFRQFFWEAELRTISQGHPDYRFIEHEKYRLAKERFPLLAGFMLIDMNDYRIARRGTEEKIKEKEEMLVKKLKQRGT